MPKLSTPSLRPEISGPLLAAAQRIAVSAPWEFMSDLELIGVREDSTGGLHIASVLGTLGTMFAVVIYRNDIGLRSIQKIVESREPAEAATLEDIDCLKVEWCRKNELQKSDLDTLNAAGFKPKGRGPVWPRFQSWQPGWYPWGVTEQEAQLMTELLSKITRFIRLRKTSGLLHAEPLENRVPIIPAGEPETLQEDEIEWLPFVPAPPPVPELLAFSAQEYDQLKRLPIRSEFVAEMIAPLVPELSFLDESAGRPCLGRVGFIADRQSHFILCARIAHGGKPLRETAGPALLEAIKKAKARPGVLRVDNDQLAAMLRPVCEALDIRVEEVPLTVAPAAFAEFEVYFRTQRPR